MNHLSYQTKFCSPPTKLFGRLSAVTVGASNFALLNFSLERFQRQPTRNHQGYILDFGFSLNMVELKDNRIRFAAVNTRVFEQVTPHELTIPSHSLRRRLFQTSRFLGSA